MEQIERCSQGEGQPEGFKDTGSIYLNYIVGMHILFYIHKTFHNRRLVRGEKAWSETQI